MQEKTYSVEQLQDGVYSVISSTSTRCNAQGEPLTSTQKQLISQLSALADFDLFSPTNFIKSIKLLVNIFCYLINRAFDYKFYIFT